MITINRKTLWWMNKFLKWAAKNKGKRLSYVSPRTYCREKWNQYGSTIVIRALGHKACLNIPAFEKLCETYLANQKKDD